MKPLKLTIEGINSFIEPVSVDFEKLQESGIFCICGPTGSGKTTILDSVILALYAPKSNNRGSLRDYVNTKCETGKVVLEFEADGEAYEVSRLFRKKENASSKAKLIKIRTGEVLADKPEDVNDRIKDMLKLEKDEFTRGAV
ncbi:MAG: SMC family ATPase [Clostridiales bacterium]|nr:SMC family ATPase [Clostridiales bacterium]